MKKTAMVAVSLVITAVYIFAISLVFEFGPAEAWQEFLIEKIFY